MFDLNEPASPVTEFEPNGTCKEYRGLTKFEQCAKDFTAAMLPNMEARYYMADSNYDSQQKASIAEAVKVGILAAEEFCRQMEEREK